MTNKLGVVLASAAAVAFLAVTGCASQQAAAPAPADSHASTKNACKNMAKCKQVHHKKAAKKESATSSTKTTSTDTKSTDTTTTTSSTDSSSK